MQRLAILTAVAAVLLSASSARAVDLVGRGSIGASAGIMKFYTGQDFKQGELRFIGQVLFKYNFSEHWATEVSSGWGWNAYPIPNTDDDTLAVVVPTTLGFEYRDRLGEASPLLGHAAAGGGIYFLGVKDTYRTWAQTPDGTQTLKWMSPGLYGKVGGEYLWDNGVSMNLDFLMHYIFSDDSERFPSGWGNQNTGFWEFRLGVNYYFNIKGGKKGGDGEGDGEEEGS